MRDSGKHLSFLFLRFLSKDIKLLGLSDFCSRSLLFRIKAILTCFSKSWKQLSCEDCGSWLSLQVWVGGIYTLFYPAFHWICAWQVTSNLSHISALLPLEWSPLPDWCLAESRVVVWGPQLCCPTPDFRRHQPVPADSSDCHKRGTISVAYSGQRSGVLLKSYNAKNSSLTTKNYPS